MTANDLIAAVIASGYVVVGYGLWRVRAAFISVGTFGWLLFPIFGLWATFYFAIAFLDESLHRTWFVWTSRMAHSLSIVLILLVIKIGHNIIDTIKDQPNA